MTRVSLKTAIEKAVAREAAEAERLAVEIHRLAEPPFHEVESSRLVADYLASRGFAVEFPYRAVPTALRAQWGSGKPCVGLLGEYDALPDCGVENGQWGHGCGHNLLGVASAVGAVAARAAIENASGKGAAKGRARGRIVYYGCPAEETLAGKVYMARDGAFRELDVCLAWHPGSDAMRVKREGGSAMDSIVYEFFGRTAHGAHADNGRSALDGAVLMDVAVNYLREHVPDNVRIHAVIRHGGVAPNVVPERARIWYYVRGLNRRQVDEIRKRIDACAQGAAIATGTRFESRRLTAVYDRLRNDALSDVLRANIELFGPPRASAADRQRAKALGHPKGFNTHIGPDTTARSRASSDEANVSWIAPSAVFQAPCYAKETRGHHRDLASQAALPFAIRGMLQAAKVFAGATVELCRDGALIRKARAEFRKRAGDFVYDPLIPRRQKPPLDPP